MYEYDICNVYDKDIFAKQCKAIEKHIPNLKKQALLEDVDGSQFQTYVFPDGKTITVENYYIFGVHVKSEVELMQYFKS